MNAPVQPLLQRMHPQRSARVRAPDVVLDTLETLIAVLSRDGLQVDERQRVTAESRVRSLWGGMRVYVGKTQSLEALQRHQRDRQILAAWSDGAAIADLSFRYGLTPRRIKQIINSNPERKSSCLNHFHANC